MGRVTVSLSLFASFSDEMAQEAVLVSRINFDFWGEQAWLIPV